MAVEQTLSIIKPDGVQKNLIGEIYSRFEKAGLEIVAARMIRDLNDTSGRWVRSSPRRALRKDDEDS